MSGDPHGIADRLHPRPVLRRREIARHLGQIIRSFVDAAMPIFTGLVAPVPEVLHVAFQVIEEELLDRGGELWLIVLDRNDAVTAAGDDLLDDVFLAAHRVDRDERVGQVDLIQELRDGRDLVGFGVGGHLTQRDALLAGPGADDVQVAEAFGLVVRSAAGLAVDSDETSGVLGVGGNRVAEPMDPQSQFCHNPDCTARGQLRLGNISVHSRKERRYRFWLL